MWRTTAIIAIFLLLIVSFLSYEEYDKRIGYEHKLDSLNRQLKTTERERVVLVNVLDSLRTSNQAIVLSDSLKSAEIKSLKTKYKNYSNKSTQEIEKELLERWNKRKEN